MNGTQYAAALVVTAFVQFHQAEAQTPPAFDLAVIKPHDLKDPGGRFDTLPGGRIVFRNLPMRFLFEYAFNVRHYQTAGEPSWFGERYDIDAKADDAGEMTDDEVKPPLRALLEQRLRLVTHEEAREVPVYDLVVEPGGPKFKASAPDTVPGVSRPSAGKVVLKKIALKAVANMLSFDPDIDRSVTDRTGLPGEFDFTLQWTPEPPPGDTATERQGPSIFTALQEQLGLKLIAKKGPDRFIVIDHVERPSEN